MFRQNSKDILKQRHLISHHNPKSTAAEQFRTIRTNIDFSEVNGELKKIMITSSSPGEGKSTVAANLAVVNAQQGKKVLLIDGDLRKPTIQYTFRLPNVNGLTTVLTKKIDLESAIQETAVKNLYVLPSGPIPPNPAELLSSPMMEALLKYALAAFDLVIFDTPPVLAVTDAQILSHLCDGSVLVVRSGLTEKELAIRAKDLLMKVQSRILGVVLNGKQAVKADGYYYYYGND
ncbi:capsular exopolysaccharide synthesis family protein [Sporolactobacillus spathodeae]|uniref:non-specific protein-tyrosine kinase n=2 Tax=Sporolactobacillus spathodeae TaxID=1465502 RepID=A0ABS2Q9W6_9BACL|nr:CpsD/CapB family tyrosine-protein kinase [Sporolactobacillus spathodeae]MBM7657762.1 capsular exopolysaccharide synthesis family protein [Sporolactobacillus spathodeae]